MENKELFLTDRVPRYLKVKMSDGELDAGDIKEESLYLEESICSEDSLRFGCCEASILKLSIICTAIPMANKKIRPYILQEKNEFQLGEYKVYSDKPTADRRYRDIVAYDAMYDILNADVADWYNTILPNADSTVTIKEFRDSFITYFGLEQEEVTLVNDSMIVAKTVEPSQMSGKTVITAICEINGCFGHIGRNGKFQYIHLKEMSDGLYPSNTLYPLDDLYPADPMNAERISKSHYISAEYEDYVTERITKLQIRQEENDIGCIYGTGNNCYIVQDNFLVYGKSPEELQTIASNLYSVISSVWYRPAHVEAKGNPCLEVGDGIRLSTKYAIVYTYILQRTLKGIQALRDAYDADGEQYQSENVNSVRDDIIQLKGKTNKLIRTVEETRLEIKDIESGLDSKITQTAQKIETEVTRAKSAEESLGSRITQTAESISSEVTRATNAESNLSSKINQTAESISAEVQRATQAEGTLSSKITQTAESISSEVTRATNAESNLSSKINQTANQIELKVSKGDVSSQLSVESGQVKITSNRFVLESTNCSISSSGKITAKDVDLSGKITASSGEISGFTIGTSAIYNGKSTLASSTAGVYIGTDGISIGTYGIYPAFKITKDGDIDLRGNGHLDFITTGNQMTLSSTGIKFGTGSAYNTDITKDKVKIYNTYIDKDTVHCARSTDSLQYYTDIYGDSIQLHGSSGSGYLNIGSTSTIWASSSGSYTIRDNSKDILATISNDMLTFTPGTLNLGAVNGRLGFFGTSKTSSKKSITKISSTSSATSSTNASKINEIIDALQAYNLIG